MQRWLRSREISEVACRIHHFPGVPMKKKPAGKSVRVAPETFLARCREDLERHVRTAWIPTVRNEEGGVSASRFGGVPWLSEDESWPVCGHCNQPMHLLVQLKLDDLPDGWGRRFGQGLFQFFYCTNDEEWWSYGSHYSPTYLLRTVQPDKRRRKPTAPRFNDHTPDPFPGRKIMGWKPVNDYPGITEFAELGIKTGGGTPEGLTIVEHEGLGLCSALDFEDEYLTLDRCVGGDKLGGWPGWKQVHTEYPRCETCEQLLRTPLLTIDSRKQIPYDFADGGRGHVFRCDQHVKNFAFPWQSG